jgi:hypothetical protein
MVNDGHTEGIRGFLPGWACRTHLTIHGVRARVEGDCEDESGATMVVTIMVSPMTRRYSMRSASGPSRVMCVCHHMPFQCDVCTSNDWPNSGMVEAFFTPRPICCCTQNRVDSPRGWCAPHPAPNTHAARHTTTRQPGARSAVRDETLYTVQLPPHKRTLRAKLGG